MLTNRNWGDLRSTFLTAEPYNHVVIDNFFEEDIARAIANEFPTYDDPQWNAHWKNAIENKKGLNHWDKFSGTIYQALHYLLGTQWVADLAKITDRVDIVPDVGLHGGGLHIHTRGGKLNVHLDYSIHPKLKLERHYNLIVYLTPNWDNAWGGGLQLWSNNPKTNQPLECVQVIENRFNRAVLFDTTQNSWHGLPEELVCPEGIYRQSLAVYYLTPPAPTASLRGKALFAPHGSQINDRSVLELIARRSQVGEAEKVYRND